MAKEHVVRVKVEPGDSEDIGFRQPKRPRPDSSKPTTAESGSGSSTAVFVRVA